MVTLLLRHEDSIKCLNLDMEYMVHLNPGPGSILGEFMTASKDWTNLKEKTAPLRHHLVVTMIDLLLTEIHNFDRSPARERTSQASLAIHAPGHLQSVSLSKLESREEATDQVKDTSFAHGGGSQDDSGNQGMSSRLSSDFEVPQLEENVQRDGQSSALLVDGEPQSSTKSMAPVAAFSLSTVLGSSFRFTSDQPIFSAVR